MAARSSSARAGQEARAGVPPGVVAAGQDDHGPVAAPHEAPGPEEGEQVVHVRTESCRWQPGAASVTRPESLQRARRPGRVRPSPRPGRVARPAAPQPAMSGLAPWSITTGRPGWRSRMVSTREVTGRTRASKARPGAASAPSAGPRPPRASTRGRQVVEHRPDAAEPWVAGERLRRGGRRRRQVHPADHAATPAARRARSRR